MADRFQQHIPLKFRPEILTDGPQAPRGLAGRIRIHDSVLEGVRGRPSISKRLAIAVQHLAAMGRTTIVKGCRDTANRGWRRTPLGGHGGMHFYLWWTPQGSPQTKGVEGLMRGAILVRAIRHHDNHKPLKPGPLNDYYQLSAADIAADSGDTFEIPWTDDQQLFALDDSPARVVHGYPGSGKTMALWKAVEARGGKTLYLTWSSPLIDASRSRFAAFAAPDTQVDVREFRVFTGSLCRRDVEKLPLEESRRRFREAFHWWKIRSHLGPWKDNLDALHAELRAVLFGRALPDLAPCTEDGMRLSGQHYIASSQAGEEAAKALLETIKRSHWRSWFEFVFPELAAAHAALDRLRSGRLPASLQAYDRVVVDEVQDLSMVEAAVVSQYCKAVAAQRPHAPRLMMAFDDGQTVRPSGFESSRLSDLLNGVLVPPEEFHLDHNVRSPSLIAEVVQRASTLYRLIGKDWRPKDQLSHQTGQEIVARVIYVPVPDEKRGRSLIEALGEVDDVAVISPRGTVPDWVPADSRGIVHTPEIVKGLEYASACVLDVGKLVNQLHLATKRHGPLELQARRTAIDGLRVAVSRATENLVFIDIEPDEKEKAYSLQLLERAEQFTPKDLTEFFLDADLPLDERILIRTRDALNLVDTSPRRAWHRALQALRLLGAPDGRAFESDESIRNEVCTGVLLVAARRMAGTGLSGQERNEVVMTAGRVSAAWGNAAQAKAFADFDDWTAGRAEAPFDVIGSALALDPADRKWMQSALPTLLQSLLRALHGCSADPRWAVGYAGHVEAWLDLIGYTGDMALAAAALRRRATESLAEAGKWDDADRVLSSLDAPDPHLAGTILEKVGKSAEAAEAYERAGLRDDALRNWRESGRLDRAVRLAEGEERTDLRWLLDMQSLIASRPDNIEARLNDAERMTLNRALESARTKAPRSSPPSAGQAGLPAGDAAPGPAPGE